MSVATWILLSYIGLGVITIIVSCIKEPMWLFVFRTWYLLPTVLPISIIMFPYVIWESFKPQDKANHRIMWFTVRRKI